MIDTGDNTVAGGPVFECQSCLALLWQDWRADHQPQFHVYVGPLRTRPQ